MPLVQIDIEETVPPERRRAIADAVNDGLVQSLGMPAADRFQILRTRPPGELIFDPPYLGVDRRQVVFIHILMVAMYDDATKQEMLTAVADQVVDAAVRRDDVFLAVEWPSSTFSRTPAGHWPGTLPAAVIPHRSLRSATSPTSPRYGRRSRPPASSSVRRPARPL